MAMTTTPNNRMKLAENQNTGGFMRTRPLGGMDDALMYGAPRRGKTWL
jgi:hypothetical protein